MKIKLINQRNRLKLVKTKSTGLESGKQYSFPPEVLLFNLPFGEKKRTIVQSSIDGGLGRKGPTKSKASALDYVYEYHLMVGWVHLAKTMENGLLAFTNPAPPREKAKYPSSRVFIIMHYRNAAIRAISVIP